MSTEFALDLRLARRKAGYTQRDIAHLLSVQQSNISALEHGRVLPSIQEIVTLSVIYGRSFESLFAQLMKNARFALRKRTPTMPKTARNYVATFNRESSIKRLRHRLSAEGDDHGSA
jgi:transcriptional regulator with XRE-family HTH domain